jgi:putative transposase
LEKSGKARKQVADWAISMKQMSIRKACELLNISERCYRYQPVLSGENEEIAEWLLHVTQRA